MSAGSAGSSGGGEIAALVRRHDPDRFLTALFAPQARRPALFALYAFNHELARAREVASEPTLALIRLHWWREVVEGAPRRHPVATSLAAAIAEGALVPDDLLALIAAREAVVEDGGFASVAGWRDWLARGAGGLAVAAARALGAAAPEDVRAHGALYGAAGVLRLAAIGGGAGLLPPGDDGVAALARAARAAAPDRRRHDPTTLAAALPAVLARRDLRRLMHGRPVAAASGRGLGDRAAVMLAGLRGRA